MRTVNVHEHRERGEKLMEANIFKWIRTLILGTVLLSPFNVVFGFETVTLVKGSDHASVTIIAYTDLLSSSSAKGSKFLNEVMKSYPDDLRIIFKPYPSLTRPDAMLAHEAVLASGEQGKFWEMHDRLLTHKGDATQEALLVYAKQLNLDTKMFLSALKEHRFKDMILHEIEEARGFGVTSAPTFFINGRKLIGVRSASDIKQVINEILGLGSIKQPVPPSPSPPLVQLQNVKIDIAGAPVKGQEDAQITIVEFSDFQCPFCAKTLPTLENVLRQYPKQVRWVFKHFPLDFHADAPLAHEAAMASGEQGKFWEMHDLIFSRQQSMRRDDLIAYAKELNLDMDRFIKAIDSGQYKETVEKDIQEGRQLGINGTPTFFVNGQRLVGARPANDFVRIIEAKMVK